MVALDLYPAVPADVDAWAGEVFPDPVAKDNFLRLLGKEYNVQLIINRKTGSFKIGKVTFYSN